jgi:glutamate/tyrosine decarboxylase-like PLP-dependent enzyme
VFKCNFREGGQCHEFLRLLTSWSLVFLELGQSSYGLYTWGLYRTGLAFKRKWQHKMKAAGKPYDKPNMVTGSNVQVRNIKGDHHSATMDFVQSDG